MAIRINNLGRSSTGATPQGVSIGDAVKPALALGSIAGAVGRVGDKLHAHDMKIMEAENAADLTEFKTAAKTAYANRMQSFAEDHDHLKYKDNWNGDLDGLRKGLADKGYSQSTLAKANEFLTGFEGDTRIAVAGAAQKKSIQRGRKQFSNSVQLIEQHFDPNNPDVARAQFLDTLGDQTHMTPEEREAATNQFDTVARRKITLHQATSDPREWLKKNPKPGKDHALWEQGRIAAKGRLRELVGEQTDSVLNGLLTGAINEDDVDGLTPDLSPVGRMELRKAVADSKNVAKREFMKTPSEQSRITGHLTTMIDSYDGEKNTEQVVKMKTLADMLSNPRDKERYLGLISEKISGREKQLKTVEDWGFKQISEMSEAGLLGKVDEVKKSRKTVRQHIEDGFFDDTEKMKSLGFKDEWIKEIQEAKNDGNGIMFWDTSKVTREAQADLFKKYWNLRDGSVPVTADQEAIELANHIAKGRKKSKGRENLDSFHSTFDDPESVLLVEAQKRSLHIARGKLEREFSEWISIRPNATMDDVQKQLEKMSVDIQAGETNTDWRSPRPSFDDYSSTSLKLPTPLQQHAQAFEHYGDKYGVDPRFLAAISMFETGRGTSSAFRNKKNLMGVSDSKGAISFDSPAASVEHMARVLSSKTGPYKNATTLKEIAAIYSPPGAGNDPNSTNHLWPSQVAKFLEEQGVANADNLQLITRL